MMPTIPIPNALADANLLGSALGDIASWRTWSVRARRGARHPAAV
jgi:hypothetical protein